MQNKHIFLVFTLASVVATGPVTAAVASNEKVEQAESPFQTFKKDIKCVFTRKGFTRKRKTRLTKQGLVLLGVVAFWYGFHIVRKPGTSNREKTIPARTGGREETQSENLAEDHEYTEKVDSMITGKTRARRELRDATQEYQTAICRAQRRYDEATERLDKFEKTVRADWKTSEKTYHDTLYDQTPEEERKKAQQAFTKASRRQRIFLQKNIDSMQSRAQ